MKENTAAAALKHPASAKGMIVKGLGGLYTVLLFAESISDPILYEKAKHCAFTVACGARGAFRHEHLTPTVGDLVTVVWDREASALDAELSGGGLHELLPRKNHLLRPPVCNLDRIYMVVAAAQPAPELYLLDKLLSVAVCKKIEPVIVITKADCDAAYAEEIAATYRQSGFRVFVSGIPDGEDPGEGARRSLAPAFADVADALRADMRRDTEGSIPKLYAVAGVSGAGKSTLMNLLFPRLSLATGGVSKIQRGRHTTRHVELFPLAQLMEEGQQPINAFLADTPGFSLLDVVNNDYFTKEQLPETFPEFAPYLVGSCRYTKCTHLREEGCSVLAAVERGEIPRSRHDSFVAMYAELKDKHEWDKKSADTVNRNGKIAGKAGAKPTFVKKKR